MTVSATQISGAYETVAASQTAQVLGGSGLAADFIAGILVIPESTSPGTVALLNNSSSMTIFAGGASSVLTLHPFYIPLNMQSVNGPWKITTGAAVHVIATGNFAV